MAEFNRVRPFFILLFFIKHEQDLAKEIGGIIILQRKTDGLMSCFQFTIKK